MMQPSCDGFSPLPETVEQIRPWWHEPGIWFWVATMVALAVIEWWAWRARRKSPSRWTQGWSRLHRWFRVLGVALFWYLSYHLFFDKVAQAVLGYIRTFGTIH
jgi:hypothetical protein